MQVFAPLANRLGIWQIKWELEDLAFRFLDPEHYRRVARLLDERRVDREARVAAMRASLAADLAAHGLAVEVQGRPKHLYSIWKKMRRKGLGFARRCSTSSRCASSSPTSPPAMRCSAASTSAIRPIAGELDDYIARPKANGYRSLHTVVQDDDGRRGRDPDPHRRDARARRVRRLRALGLQGGRRARTPRSAPAARSRPASPRRAWSCCASCSPGSATSPATTTAGAGTSARDGALAAPRVFDDRIYVFTPQAAVVELTAGATPIDFAYAVHTDLGHRCRGARVDGAMVPLNTPLQSGQMVEVTAAKTGGPSLDWLNPELGYPAERALEGQGARLVQRARAGGDDRARPRGGRKAPAARGQDGAQARRAGDAGSAFAAPTRCSRSSARTSSR